MDAVKAMEWLSKAAEGGYSEALYDLGYIYEEGKDSWEGLKGIPQDLKKAEEFYLKAAERGSVSAARALVYMYQDRGEKKKAADFSFRVAELGDASYFGSAHFQMGVLYVKGEDGVKKDYNKAIESFLKAVESGGKLGYGAAEFNLGLIYFYGYGVKKDRKTAAEWMIKAAEHHELDAQVNLGYMYEHAEGVERDYLKAKEWYEKAAKRGAATAQYNLGVLYMNGSFGKADNLLGCAWVYISKNHNNKFCDPAYSNVSEEEVLKMVRKIKEENPMIK
jgi:TPR repeat protein